MTNALQRKLVVLIVTAMNEAEGPNTTYEERVKISQRLTKEILAAIEENGKK